MRSCGELLPFLKLEDRSIHSSLSNEVIPQLLVIFLGSKLIKIQNNTVALLLKLACVYIPVSDTLTLIPQSNPKVEKDWMNLYHTPSFQFPW